MTDATAIDVITIVLVPLGIGLVGALVGAWLTPMISGWLAERNERREKKESLLSEHSKTLIDNVFKLWFKIPDTAGYPYHHKITTIFIVEGYYAVNGSRRINEVHEPKGLLAESAKEHLRAGRKD